MSLQVQAMGEQNLAAMAFAGPAGGMQTFIPVVTKGSV